MAKQNPQSNPLTQDPEIQQYFQSLPPYIQETIYQSGVEAAASAVRGRVDEKITVRKNTRETACRLIRTPSRGFSFFLGIMHDCLPAFGQNQSEKSVPYCHYRLCAVIIV